MLPLFRGRLRTESAGGSVRPALQLSSPMISEQQITDALKAVKYPGYSRDIISFGIVKHIAASNGAVSVTIQLTSANNEAAQQIKAEAERVLRGVAGVQMVSV